MLCLRRENAQGLVEYALILVLVAIGVMAMLAVLGSTISGVFSYVVDSLNAGTAGTEPPPEPGGDCYGSLLLPYLVGLTLLCLTIFRLKPVAGSAINTA